MDNPTPLEKTILDIPLGGGVNERDRPEIGRPGAPPFLTRVDNLLQEQSGSWSKRPGSDQLGDGSGGALVKLLRIRGGGLAGMTASDFKVYAEAWEGFTTVGSVPAMTVEKADLVVSSGDSESARVLAVASSTKYHVVISDSAYGTSQYDHVISFYDRKLGSLVASYTTLGISLAQAEGYTPSVSEAVVVAIGEKFHFFYTMEDSAALEHHVLGFVIDGASALPATSAINTTELETSAGGGFTILDFAAGSDRSYVLYTAGGTTTVRSMSGAAASLSSDTIAGAIRIYATDSKLWFLTSTNLGARSLTTLTAVDVASAAHGGYGTGEPYMYVSNAERVYLAVQNPSVTFGGTTIYSVSYYATASPDATALGLGGYIDGWKLCASPFGIGTNSAVYIHVVKDNKLSSAQHCVISLTEATAYTTSGIPLTSLITSLEPHFGFVGLPATATLKPRYYPTHGSSPSDMGGSVFGVVVPIQTVARGFSYAVYNLVLGGHSRCTSAEFGGVTHISGGFNASYSGGYADTGFSDQPLVDAADSGVAGSPNGAYKYIAVFRYVDAIGNVTFSRVSNIASVTVVSKKVTLNITAPTVGEKYGNVEIYRTKAGGTIYYLCGTTQRDTTFQQITMARGTQRFCTLTDNYSDLTLGSSPLLFRQPGTANAALDRYPPPAGLVQCQHKDRLFIVEPSGVRVMYSSFHVDGEAAWFNPSFSFVVHGASGGVTALASMDGRLFVFKKDGIFVVDGDGPPEGGVSGNEFSPPMRLATEYGCVDQRSMAVTTEGIIYRSQRGIELLTRSLQVKWIGERVQNTVDDYNCVKGACLDHSGRYRILLADASAASTGETSDILNGAELVYDIPGDCWSRMLYGSNVNSSCKIYASVAMADIHGLGETVCYAAESGVRYQSLVTSIDEDYTSLATEYYVPFCIETSWIKTGQQARHRFTKALFLAKKLSGSNHALTIALAFNYADSYTQTKTFQPGTFNSAAIEELMVQIASQEALAVRIRIIDGAPSDTVTYPSGYGKACDILGVSAEVAPKRGAPKLASDQRG